MNTLMYWACPSYLGDFYNHHALGPNNIFLWCGIDGNQHPINVSYKNVQLANLSTIHIPLN